MNYYKLIPAIIITAFIIIAVVAGNKALNDFKNDYNNATTVARDYNYGK